MMAWAGLAVLGVFLLSFTWRVISPQDERRAASQKDETSSPKTSDTPFGLSVELTLFALAYTIAGFGYIVTATYLPLIARASLPPSIWLDLFWPIYGVAAAIGSLAIIRIYGMISTRHQLAICHVMSCRLAAWF